MTNLNELEYADGDVWTNIFLSNEILRIDIKTGTAMTSIKIPRAMN